MYNYAVAHDIADKDYASVMFANGNPIKQRSLKEAVPFTDEETLRIWDSKDVIPFADMIFRNLQRMETTRTIYTADC